MKKRSLILTLVFCMLCSMMSFGKELDMGQDTGISLITELLPEDIEYSCGFYEGVSRGNYISLAGVEIGNLGNGYVEVISNTVAHADCDRIKMKVYLDQYDEATDTWKNIKTFNYDVSSEDVGGGLHALNESEKVKVTKGKYYRARGSHYVYSGGKSEGFSSATDGILAD